MVFRSNFLANARIGYTTGSDTSSANHANRKHLNQSACAFQVGFVHGCGALPLRHCDGKDASYNTHLRLAGYRYYQGHVRQATELSVPFWRRQRLGATAAVALLAQASYVGHRFLSLYSYYSMHRIVQELVVLRRLPLAPERQTPWHWQCHWHAVNFFAQLTIQCTG